MQKIDNPHKYNYDLEVELRAVQNEDFEQEYLQHCLKDSHRKLSLTNNQLQILTKSEKSPDPFDFRTPKESAQFNLNNFQTSEIQQSELIQNCTNHEKCKSTGSSIMQFFFIRKFLEQITLQRRRLETLNNTHLNLIDDRASDKALIFAYKQTKVQKGLTINQLNKIINTKFEIKEKKWQKVIETIKEKKQKAIQIITYLLNYIPLIQPENEYKLYWDIFASIFRIILVVLIPLEISFNTQIMFQNTLVLTIIIFFILQIDLFIRLNTLVYENGKALTDRWVIIQKQIKKSWFTDLSLAIIIIVFSCFRNISGHYDLFLLILLTQYKHILESLSKTDQISYFNRPQRGIIGLIKFLTSLLYILHLFSCIWYWFSSINLPNSWITSKGLDEQDWQLQYLESIYFAIVTMLTIGYGDNVPKNSIEKIVAIIFILGACLWFSYSVNFIGGIMNDITQNQVERSQKMRVINKYMTQRKIPFNIQHQVKEYLTYRWKEDDEVDLEMEQQLLEQLSDELKEELEKSAYKVFIEKSEFLQKEFSAEFRNALFKSIKRKIIQPQHFVTSEINGEQHLCFVEQGMLLYQHRDRKYRHKMNAQVNQGQFFCVKEFLMSNSDYELFKAQSYVSLLILSKKDFLDSIKDFPDDFQKFCQIRDQYQFDDLKIKNGEFCPACSNFEHNLQNCNQIQLKLNKEVVIKKHLINKQQERKQFQRRKINQPIQTRIEMAFVQECTNYFQADKQNLIQEQLKIQLVYEPEIESNMQSETINIYDPLPSINVLQNNDMYASTHKPIIQSKHVSKIELDDDKIKDKNDCMLKSTVLPQQNKRTRRGSVSSKQLKRLNTRQPSILIAVDEITEDANDSTFLIQDNEYTKQILNFNAQMKENIKFLYNKLLRYYDEKDQQINQAISYLQFTYWEQNAVNLQNFDSICCYDHFNTQYNIDHVINLANKNQFQWQNPTLKRFLKYLNYPFIYITKYLKLKRFQQQTSVETAVSKFKKAQKKFWLISLRNNMSSRKVITSQKNIKISKSKISSIVPFSGDSQQSIQLTQN